MRITKERIGEMLANKYVGTAILGRALASFWMVMVITPLLFWRVAFWRRPEFPIVTILVILFWCIISSTLFWYYADGKEWKRWRSHAGAWLETFINPSITGIRVIAEVFIRSCATLVHFSGIIFLFAAAFHLNVLKSLLLTLSNASDLSDGSLESLVNLLWGLSVAWTLMRDSTVANLVNESIGGYAAKMARSHSKEEPHGQP